MESDLSYLIVLIGCVVFSAIFSSAETALTTLPEAYLRKLVDEQKVLVKPLSLWLSKPNRVLTTIIVGNNLVNTMAAVVATVYAQKLFGQYVISIATGFVTVVLLIFGEITPKTFARHNARKLVVWLMAIIYPIYFLLLPAVWVLSFFAVKLVHLLGGHTKRVGPMATEEDIAYLIRVSHEEGVFKAEQGQMLQSVITFRDTSVREIMVSRTELFSFPLEASFDEVLSQVAQYGYTRWPVYDQDIDHVVGVFYVKDLINFQNEDGKDFRLKDHLREAIFIPDAMKLDAALREFQRKKVHLGVVVDEYGGTAGIVTLEDILEEIVGEIRDEYDKEEEEPVKQIGEHHFIADGRTSISDLERLCGVELPSDASFETLGGFVITAFGEIPRKNAEYEFKGWKFRVIEVEEKRVVKVEIMRVSDGKPHSS